jgi:hypothetical protein
MRVKRLIPWASGAAKGSRCFGFCDLVRADLSQSWKTKMEFRSQGERLS